MYGYIYKFVNKSNNKIYIGKHKYDKPILDEHYIASGILINRSIKKYGLDNFEHQLIAIAETEDELNELEKYYIKLFNSEYPVGYNLTSGGDGISNPSDDIKNKNRLWHLGRKQSEKTKLKRAETHKLIKRTDEWKKHISDGLKGKKPKQSTVDASSKRHKNSKWYNDGINEFMIVDESQITVDMVPGRLKNPFPNQTGIKKSKTSIDKMRVKLQHKQWCNNSIEELFVDEIPEGFVKGRLIHTSTTKNKHCYNNGVINKFLSDTDVIPEGFVKGMLKKN